MGNLRLVYVYRTDPFRKEYGGMNAYIRFLTRQALKNGIQVRFVGVKLCEYQNNNPNLKFIPILKGIDIWWIYLLASFFYVPFLKIDPNEIIHSGRMIFLLPYILFNRKNLKILTSDQPRLAAYLRYPKPIYYILSAIYTPIEHFMIKRVQAVIAAKHVLENYWKKRYPSLKHIFQERIYPAVGVNIEEFIPLNNKIRVTVRESLGISPTSKVILFVGRLSIIKGIDFLMDAFSEYSFAESDSFFLIVGGGEYEKRLREYRKRNPFKDKIIFVGIKTGQDLVDFYNCADVLVIGSLAEGNPGVIREALACGIPVVTMNVGDAKDIINDPLLGRIVLERDPKLFATAIKEVMLENKENVGEACRRRSFEFSEEICFDSVYNLYKELNRKWTTR